MTDYIYIYCFGEEDPLGISWVKYKYHPGNWTSSPNIEILSIEKTSGQLSVELLDKIEKRILAWHERPAPMTDEEKDQC